MKRTGKKQAKEDDNDVRKITDNEEERKSADEFGKCAVTRYALKYT